MAMKIGFCLLVSLATIWITNGFSTEKCDHSQLSEKLQQLTTCFGTELSNLVDQLLKDFKEQVNANNNSYDLKKGCPAITSHSDNVKNCAIALASSCLDGKTTDLMKHVFKATSILCNNLLYIIKPPGTWHTHGYQPPQELKNWIVEFENQLKLWDPNPLVAFTNLVELDKKCNQQTIASTYQKMDTTKCAIAADNLISPFKMYVNGQISQNVAVCTALDNLYESCVVENDCVSSQEIELIKKVAWRIYPLLMNTLVKIKDSFGGMKETIDVIGRTTFMLENKKVWGSLDSEMKNSSFRSEIKSRIGGIGSKVIDDFENQKCQTKIAQQSGNSGQNNENSGRDSENTGTTGKSGQVSENSGQDSQTSSGTGKSEQGSQNSGRNVKFSYLIINFIQLIHMLYFL